MSRIDQIEDQIKELSAEELRSLRDWFLDYDAEIWDRQFEADVNAGKLEEIARRALDDHEKGRSTEL
jgi:hypothetical protein